MNATTNRRLFLEQYGRIRQAEGRGSDEPSYYRALPYLPPGAPLADQWAIRARTFGYFVERILPERPSRILDLGAGTGWLSNRLTQRGHLCVALDLFRDPRDGLLAKNHFDCDFPATESHFDQLPFREASFDMAVFNASFHYSADYARTLREVARILRPRCKVVILDTPVYAQPGHGELMKLERQAQFERVYGFRSEALNSIEYLDEPEMERLARELKIQWRIHRPWYGLAWHLRPLRARLARRRPPSRFWVLEGSFV